MKRKLKFRLSILAIALATSLLAGCGEKPEAMVASAKEYLAKNDRSAAVIQLKNALQENPNLAEARLLLGKTQLQGGDLASAEKELRKALELKVPVGAGRACAGRSAGAKRSGEKGDRRIRRGVDRRCGCERRHAADGARAGVPVDRQCRGGNGGVCGGRGGEPGLWTRNSGAGLPQGGRPRSSRCPRAGRRPRSPRIPSSSKHAS